MRMTGPKGVLPFAGDHGLYEGRDKAPSPNNLWLNHDWQMNYVIDARC